MSAPTIHRSLSARPTWDTWRAAEYRPIRSHRRPSVWRAFWRRVWRLIGDLAIWSLWFVVSMMAGALFVYGTWSR